jgi:hypothetical protein
MSMQSNDADQHGGQADGDGTPSKQGPAQGSSCCLGLVITGLAVVFVLWMLMPLIGRPREDAFVGQCHDNLRSIGRAMHAYEKEYGCFPPAFIADQSGKPKHSWRVLILPFLGENELYKQYRLDEPWNSPHNSQLAARMPPAYGCPSCVRFLGREYLHSLTSYAMIVGPHAFSDGPTPRKLSDIRDNPATTAMVAECAGAGINWLEPRDLDVAKMAFRIAPVGHVQDSERIDISACHTSGAQLLFLDLSVSVVPERIRPDRLRAFLTIDGRESVRKDDLE